MGTFSSIRGHLALLPLALALASCGDKASDPPCGGIENNGVCLYVSSIMPQYRGANTPSVDVAQTTAGAGCTNGEDNISAHVASITIGATTMGGTPTNATRITIYSYSIDYVPVATAVTPLAITSETYGENIILNVGSSVTSTFNLFTEIQKDTFDTSDPGSYPSYDVTYTIRGRDEYGRLIYTTATTQVTVGDFAQAECEA